jgi:hypothetical protein
LTTAIAHRQDTSIIEEVITKGDLSKLSPDQRAAYYTQVCESMGLNPLSQPFQYVTLNGKLQLYATKGATDQLNRVHGISVVIQSTEIINDVYVVRALGTDADGRQGSDIGAVHIGRLQGDALANAMMKATTKAKRRVTMGMCGLGMLDETEVDTIPTARHERVMPDGEIVEVSPQVSQIAPQSTETHETVLIESFDLRLEDAVSETDKAKRRAAFGTLYKEALADKSVRKIELLVKAMPEGDYTKAEAMMTDAFEKHQMFDPSWNVALKARVDAPAEFVDVNSGEIVE